MSAQSFQTVLMVPVELSIMAHDAKTAAAMARDELRRYRSDRLPGIDGFILHVMPEGGVLGGTYTPRSP